MILKCLKITASVHTETCVNLLIASSTQKQTNTIWWQKWFYNYPPFNLGSKVMHHWLCFSRYKDWFSFYTSTTKMFVPLNPTVSITIVLQAKIKLSGLWSGQMSLVVIIRPPWNFSVKTPHPVCISWIIMSDVKVVEPQVQTFRMKINAQHISIENAKY